MSEFVRVPEPTEEMQEAGRSAVMARDCAGPKWTPRQHYDASGNDALIAATPDWILDCKGPLPKHIGALLVWYAMHSAAPTAPPASPGPEPLTVPASVYDALATERDSIRSALNLICWRWAKPSAADAEWLNDFLTTHDERAPRADHYRNQCAQGKEE